MKTIRVKATDFKQNYGKWRLEALRGSVIDISYNGRDPELCLISADYLKTLINTSVTEEKLK